MIAASATDLKQAQDDITFLAQMMQVREHATPSEYDRLAKIAGRAPRFQPKTPKVTVQLDENQVTLLIKALGLIGITSEIDTPLGRLVRELLATDCADGDPDRLFWLDLQRRLAHNAP